MRWSRASVLALLIVPAMLNMPAIAQGNVPADAGSVGRENAAEHSSAGDLGNAGGVGAPAAGGPPEGRDGMEGHGNAPGRQNPTAGLGDDPGRHLAQQETAQEPALPFDQLAAIVQQSEKGRIIETRRLEEGGKAVYELKILRPEGDVDLVYYDAASGQKVR